MCKDINGIVIYLCYLLKIQHTSHVGGMNIDNEVLKATLYKKKSKEIG